MLFSDLFTTDICEDINTIDLHLLQSSFMHLRHLLYLISGKSVIPPLRMYRYYDF